MNGGTFTPGVEKERGGIYSRFTSAAAEQMATGDRGRAALPFILSWGPVKTFVEISNNEDIETKLGLPVDDSSLLLLKEAKKKSQTVLSYRINDGVKATGSIGASATATAKYSGTKGNDITIAVQTNVLDATKKDVITYMANREVDRQTVVSAENLKANAVVTFGGTGALTNSAGIKLTGGTNGAPTNADYTDFFAAAEREYFDVIGLPYDGDAALKATFVSFVKRLRDSQGVKIRGVVPNFAGDFEGITNSTTGVILSDGTELSVADTVAWVTGAAAGATVHQSLSFVEYEGAVDVSPRLDNDEIIARLKAGEFLLTVDPREKTVSVEQDINSFVSFTDEKNKKFSKNKIIRILDAITNDITSELKALIKERKEAGQDIPANNDGIQFVRTLVTIYMNALQEGGAIQNFNSQDDIQITLNNDGDGFYINMGAEPLDSAEKFYFGMEVR